MALTDDLLAYWDMDEASGPRSDAHASYDLTDNNTVTQSSSGGPGSADCALYDASNNEYLSNTSTDFQMGDIQFMVLGWVYRTNSGSYWFSRFLSNGNRQFALNDQTGGHQFIVSGDGSDTTKVRIAESFSASTWYFVCGWHDPTGNNIYVEVDNGTPTFGSHTTGCYAGTSNLIIGARESGTTSNMSGRTCYCAVYKNGYPDSTDRGTLYNSGSGSAYADISGGGPSVYPWWYYQMMSRGCTPEEAEYEARAIVAKRAAFLLAKRRDRISLKARHRWQLDPKTKMYLPPACGIITPRWFIGRAA